MLRVIAELRAWLLRNGLSGKVRIYIDFTTEAEEIRAINSCCDSLKSISLHPDFLPGTDHFLIMGIPVSFRVMGQCHPIIT
jgi:hypothetical protein